MNVIRVTSVIAAALAAVVVGSASLSAQDAATLETEQAHLNAARENIEQHRKSDARLTLIDREGAPLENLNVEINQVTQDFLFGNTAFDLARTNNPDDPALDSFKARYKALFNYGILPFYWSAYEPHQGKPEWQRMQQAIDWCLANGITVKGHPLGWTHPAGTPDWLLELPAEAAFTLYEARVRNTVSGFRGQVDTWDVVNEPVTTIPLQRVFADRSNADGRIGEGSRYDVADVSVEEIAPWVADSFKWAHSANPQGEYILNDFNLIAVPATRERFYQLVQTLFERGAPISGLGIQAHEPREMWYPPAEAQATFDRLAELGLPLHITEFIPQSSGKPITGGWRKGTWTEEAQADFAEQFYTLAFGHPAIKSITWWGLSDADIWLDGGGLLDERYQPKPVYNRLLQLIKSEWMTKGLDLATDQDGAVVFRGFHGEYDLTVTRPDGTVATFRLHLREDEANEWRFTL